MIVFHSNRVQSRVRLDDSSGKGTRGALRIRRSIWTVAQQTTVTPGDMICKDGQELGEFVVTCFGPPEGGVRKTQSYEVPPNTLDAPDPEDEFEELDDAIDTLDCC